MNSLQPFPEEFQRLVSKVSVKEDYPQNVAQVKYSLLDAENNKVPGGGDFNRPDAYTELKVMPTIEVSVPNLLKKTPESLAEPFIAAAKNIIALYENERTPIGDYNIQDTEIMEPVTLTKSDDGNSEKNPKKKSNGDYSNKKTSDETQKLYSETSINNSKSTSSLKCISQDNDNDCEECTVWQDCYEGDDDAIEETDLPTLIQASDIYPLLRKNKKKRKDIPEPMDGTPLPLRESPSMIIAKHEAKIQSFVPGIVRSVLDKILQPFGGVSESPASTAEEDEHDRFHRERPKWDNQLEFLMSCIATSVGLGNVWRFPFVAYEHGGGAFLVPYCIVLVLIGNSMYFLETSLGQFSSSNNVRLWALCPAMRGTGFAQALGASYVLSYYVSIIALCIYYLFASFASTLPWAVCQAGWDNCVPSVVVGTPASTSVNSTASAEYFFKRVVLRQSNGIHGGIGLPFWDLALCLFFSWFMIFLIVVRGVKSSGKAAWFLALFPYVIMFILLIRAVTLPGAGKGILYFIKPVWGKLMDIKVWYAAVTQVFFSLSVCSGALIMYASYNGFRTNVFRYSMIVSGLDTFTSLISGITIFGVLGNLAYELGVDDVGRVIGTGGTSLAFISYPDAIAKTPFAPQVFAVLFFLMMVVLGIGSGVALLSTVNAVLMDSFPKVKIVYMSSFNCSVFFLVGLVYVTPGGQYILELVDYFGGTFMRLFAAIVESIGVFWIYGLENICLDIEFMLHRRPGPYWRICWAIVTPLLMITVFIYAVVTRKALKFGQTYVYPNAAYFAGNFMQYSGMALIPLFICITIYKYRVKTCKESVKIAFTKRPTYGPAIREVRHEWREFVGEAVKDRMKKRKNWLHHIYMSLTNGYRGSVR